LHYVGHSLGKPHEYAKPHVGGLDNKKAVGVSTIPYHYCFECIGTKHIKLIAVYMVMRSLPLKQIIWMNFLTRFRIERNVHILVSPCDIPALIPSGVDGSSKMVVNNP